MLSLPKGLPVIAGAPPFATQRTFVRRCQSGGHSQGAASRLIDRRPGTGSTRIFGSIEVGKEADVTILDIMRPEWQPIPNPVANLVYCAHGGCADTVIVGGRILMQGGKVVTLDEHDLYEEAYDRAKSRTASPS